VIECERREEVDVVVAKTISIVVVDCCSFRRFTLSSFH
jgi:hypothetical protein